MPYFTLLCLHNPDGNNYLFSKGESWKMTDGKASKLQECYRLLSQGFLNSSSFRYDQYEVLTCDKYIVVLLKNPP
jgi:hypothetical protein